MDNQKGFKVTFELRLGALIRDMFGKELGKGDMVPVEGAMLVRVGGLGVLIRLWPVTTLKGSYDTWLRAACRQSLPPHPPVSCSVALGCT